jgi:endonuclease YncB( thermonuclease family)
MRFRIKKAPLTLTLIVLIALAASAAGVISFMRAPETGLVVSKVFDGDSIVLSDGREIRYIGIDAPETGGNRPAEYGGKEAADLNERLAAEKEIRLEFDVEAKDHYGRTLAYVYVGDTMINRELVAAGVAPAVSYPPNLRHVKELSAAMDEARRARRGLWADTGRWMVDANEAGDYIGESKTVVGRVLSTGVVRAGIFLNFGSDFKTDFTAFIPTQYLTLYFMTAVADPTLAYRGRVIEVTGTINERNGPTIRVTHPDQIYIRD